MKPIKSIEKELAACRKAFAEHPNAKLVWCCHHTVLVEKLTEPFENRISYILSNKPEEERATRFRNFRPVKNKATIARPYKDYKTAKAQALIDYSAAIAKTWEAYYAATAKAVEDCQTACKLAEKPLVAILSQEWPDHTWNGDSIF